MDEERIAEERELDTFDEGQKRIQEDVYNAKPAKPSLRYRLPDILASGLIGAFIVLFVIGSFITFTGDNISKTRAVAKARADFEKTIAGIDAKTSEAIAKVRREKDAVIAELQAKLEKKNVIPAEAGIQNGFRVKPGMTGTEEISTNFIKKSKTSSLNSIGRVLTAFVLVGFVVAFVILFKYEKIALYIWLGILFAIGGGVGIGGFGIDNVETATCQIHGELVTEKEKLPWGYVKEINITERGCGCYGMAVTASAGNIETHSIDRELAEKIANQKVRLTPTCLSLDGAPCDSPYCAKTRHPKIKVIKREAEQKKKKSISISIHPFYVELENGERLWYSEKPKQQKELHPALRDPF